ncbi:MAG: hypothetical protein JAY72_07930 [Candidatus Thiodiazotropha endolucinida]|nr:hypothetical protein [Candidatus Thiodiazotropha taylori]MCW4321595.1 hypothetical protein [Candidatus Thiodiazotropha taylori]
MSDKVQIKINREDEPQSFFYAGYQYNDGSNSELPEDSIAKFDVDADSTYQSDIFNVVNITIEPGHYFTGASAFRRVQAFFSKGKDNPDLDILYYALYEVDENESRLSDAYETKIDRSAIDLHLSSESNGVKVYAFDPVELTTPTDKDYIDRTFKVFCVYSDGAISSKEEGTSKTIRIKRPGSGDRALISHQFVDYTKDEAKITGATVKFLVSIAPGNERSFEEVSHFNLYFYDEDKTTLIFETQVDPDTGLEQENLTGDPGASFYVKSNIVFKDGATTGQLPEDGVAFIIPDPGDDDYAYIEESSFLPTAEFYSEEEATVLRTLRFDVKYPEENDKPLGSVAAFIFLKELAGGWQEIDQLTSDDRMSSDDLNDFELSFPANTGPDHKFKIQIRHTDGSVSQETVDSPPRISTWTDPDFGKGEGTLVRSAERVGEENGYPTIKIEFDRTETSYRTDAIRYELEIDYLDGDGFINSGESVEGVTPFYFVVGKKVPGLKFRVVGYFPGLHDPDVESQIPYEDTAELQWENDLWGLHDHVNVIDIALTSEDLSKNKIVTLKFELDSNNDKDSLISGFFVVKKDPVSGLFDYDTIVTSTADPSARSLEVTHKPREDKTHSVYKVLIRYAKPHDWDDIYGNRVFSVTSSRPDAPDFLFTYHDYGSGDFITLKEVSIDPAFSEGRKIKLIIPFQSGAFNDRTDEVNHKLYQSNSPDAGFVHAVDAQAINDEFHVIVDSSHGEAFFFKAIIVFSDQSSSDIDIAPVISWENKEYGKYDKIVVDSVLYDKEVIDENGKPLASFIVAYTPWQNNDRLNLAGYKIFELDQGSLDPEKKFILKKEIERGDLFQTELLFNQDQGPKYTIKIQGVFVDGSTTDLDVTEETELVFPEYGEKDHTDINLIELGDRGTDSQGDYTFAVIHYSDNKDNDRKNTLSHYLYYKDNAHDIFTRAEVAIDQVAGTLTFKCRDSAYPHWIFRVIPIFDDGKEGKLDHAPEKDIYIYDPPGSDVVDMLPLSFERVSESASLVKIPFVYRNEARFRKNPVSYSLWRAKIPFSDLEDKPEEELFPEYLEVDSKLHGEDSFEVTIEDSEKFAFRWKVTAKFEDHWGGGSTSLEKTSYEEYLEYDPGNTDKAKVVLVTQSGVDKKHGQNRSLIKVSTDFSLVKRPYKTIKNYSVYASRKSNPQSLSDFFLFSTSGQLDEIFYVNGASGTKYIDRKGSPTFAFVAIVNFIDGKRTSFRAADVFLWSIPDYGDEDTVSLIGPENKGHFGDGAKAYTELEFRFSFPEENDHLDSDIRYINLLHKDGENNNVVDTATVGELAHYSALDVDGPDFAFSAVASFSDGTSTKITAQSETVWTNTNYAVNDSNDILSVIPIGKDIVAPEGEKPHRETELSIKFAPNENNDRTSGFKSFRLLKKENDSENFALVHTYDYIDTHVDTEGIFTIRHKVNDKDGPIHTFKVLTVYLDGAENSPDVTNSYDWRDSDYGRHDTVTFISHEISPLVDLTSDGPIRTYATPIKLHFDVADANDREDQTTYIIDVKTKSGGWTEAGRISSLSTFVYNAKVSDGPDFTFTIRMAYADGTESLESQDYSISVLDPANSDYAEITSAEVVSRFTREHPDSSPGAVQSGSIIRLNYKPATKNLRTEIKSYQLWMAQDEEDTFSLVDVSEDLEGKRAEIEISDSVKHYYFKVVLDFGNTQTNLETAPVFFFDNTDPAGDDHISITSIVSAGRLTGSISGTSLYIYFEPDENNNHPPSDFESYTLYIDRGTGNGFTKEKVIFPPSDRFNFDAYDHESPWKFKVAGTLSGSGKETSLSVTPEMDFALVDPEGTDHAIITSIDRNDRLFDSTKGNYYRLSIDFDEAEDNKRKNPVGFTLWKSIDGNEYTRVDRSTSRRSFYYDMYSKIEPKIFFKVTCDFEDNSETSLLASSATEYFYPERGRNDHAKISSVTTGPATQNGTLVYIFGYWPESNDLHADEITGYQLMVMTREGDGYQVAPITPLTSLSQPFTFEAKEDEGPVFKFWIRATHPWGETSFQAGEGFVGEFVDNSHDHAVIQSIIEADRSIDNQGVGKVRFIIPFKPGDNNVRN